MILYTQDQKPIQIGNELSHGVEGTVYDVSDEMVAKVFFEPQPRYEKLKRIFDKGIRHPHICTPQEILYDKEGNFVGYLMQKANGYPLQNSIFQPQLFKIRFPKWTRVELTRFTISLLETVNFLHKRNVLIGDINPNNIIVNDFNDFYLLDTDSFQIDDLPCPVGTVEYTAPEIQGLNFGDFLRTKEHEYFSLATLLFKIYVPGKHPYSRVGGQTIQENIIAHDFVFPLGDVDENATPKGQWEAIWYNLSFEVRKIFYEIFRENQRRSTEEWMPVLRNYLSELESNLYNRDIFPLSSDSLYQDKTLNMNRRDVTDKDKELREIKTVLRSENGINKFAVLELSTKAVKLLIGENPSEIKENLGKDIRFDFNQFYRESTKTDTGRGLNRNNVMDMEYFRGKVLPVIERYKEIARSRGVNAIYTVATAAYRTANNREEILACIREEAGVNVRILTKEEEAHATIGAFSFSTRNKNEFRRAQYQMIIDQGGGSTEVSLFANSESIKSYSMNLGTEVLRNILFRESNEQTTLRQALANADKLIRDRLDTLYRNITDVYPTEGEVTCVAVGTAITKATGKKGNAKQHDTVLTIEDLGDKVKLLDESLKSKYTYARELHYVVNNESYSRSKDELDGQIVMRLGLPMYIAIMKKLGIVKLTVSGTGLWYGIYFQHLFNDESI